LDCFLNSGFCLMNSLNVTKYKSSGFNPRAAIAFNDRGLYIEIKFY